MSEADLRRFRRELQRVSARQSFLERYGRVAMRAWCRLVAWRVDVDGTGTLPGAAPHRRGAGCLIVPVPHRAWIEPFLVLQAWPSDAARLVWFADGRTVTRSWWRRRFLARVGVVPIHGGPRGPQAYAELAAEALDAGAALVAFPEVGPPSPPDRSRRISPGFAYIARRTGAPIVPVVIGGTHHIVRGSAFTVDFLEPIDPGDPDPEAFSTRARARAHELAGRYEEVVSGVLPSRTVLADARRPRRDRWRWLARLFD